MTRIVRDAHDLGEQWYQEMQKAPMSDGGNAEAAMEQGVQEEGMVLEPDWYRRVGWKIGTSWGGRMRQYRVYAFTDDVAGLRRARPDLFSNRPVQLIGELIVAGKEGKRAYRLRDSSHGEI